MMVDQHYTVKAEHCDSSFANRDGFLRLQHHRIGGDEAWSEGEFVDPRGIVSVMRSSGYTRLDFAAHDRLYTRTWRRYYGDRTIAQLARAFITDLLANSPSTGDQS